MRKCLCIVFVLFLVMNPAFCDENSPLEEYLDRLPEKVVWAPEGYSYTDSERHMMESLLVEAMELEPENGWAWFHYALFLEDVCDMYEAYCRAYEYGDERCKAAAAYELAALQNLRESLHFKWEYLYGAEWMENEDLRQLDEALQSGAYSMEEAHELARNNLPENTFMDMDWSERAMVYYYVLSMEEVLYGQDEYLVETEKCLSYLQQIEAPSVYIQIVSSALCAEYYEKRDVEAFDKAYDVYIKSTENEDGYWMEGLMFWGDYQEEYEELHAQ